MGSILLVLFPAIALLIYARLDGHILKKLDPNKKWLPKLLVFCTIAACLLEIYKNSVESKLAIQAEEDRKQAAKDRDQAATDATKFQARIDQLTQEIEKKTIEYQEKLQEDRLNFLRAQSEAELRAIRTEF